MASMERSEVICISSDEEEEIHQKKNERIEESVSKESSVNNSTHMKQEIASDEDGKKEAAGKKRKASQVNDNNIKSPNKKMKTVSGEAEKTTNADSIDTTSKELECTPQKIQQEVLKPKLVVKERKSIPQIQQDIFSMFISLCLQKDRSEDMKIIVNKLKRRYEQLDPVYASSEGFRNFLNEKRNDIINSNNKVYIYIAEVMNEMKSSCKGKSALLINRQNCTNNASLSALVSNHNAVKENVTIREKADDEKEQKKYDIREKKIAMILKAMEKCEKYIKRLEEEEIDFSDENNSNYMKLERYKYRMVELYNKYCEYIGESADAARPYLRPKHFGTTGIVAVDQAITSFINSKISKRKNIKKIGDFAKALIFPDYTDILQCVTRCNELHNLGLNKTKQHKIAKKAFTELGEYLQRIRRNDYWDTFSLFLEDKDDDPATKDPILAQKLSQNKREGDKRLAGVFQEYVKKQEEMKARNSEDKTTSGNEDDEDDEDDNLEMQDELQNDLNEGNSDSTGRLSMDDDQSNDQNDNNIDNNKTAKCKDDLKANDKHSTDRTETRTSHVEIIKNLETSSKVSCTNDKTVSNDDSLKSIDVGNVTHTSNSQNNKKSDETEETSITVLPNATSSQGTTSSNVKLSATVVDTVTVPIDRTEEDVPIMVPEKSTDSKPQEKDKPLLRVRSFAKPPMTWEDVREKADEPSSNEKASKVVTKDTVIDLTNETPKQSSIFTKCTTVQVGSKILPVMKGEVVKGKCRTFVIPVSGKNVINVRNITNNYVRLNAHDISSSNVSKLKTGQVLTSLQQVAGVNGGSTIVRLPSNRSTGQDSTNATSAIQIPQGKQNAIIRIIQPSKTTFIPAKQVMSAIQPAKTNSAMPTLK